MWKVLGYIDLFLIVILIILFLQDFFSNHFSMTDLLIYQKCVSFNQLQSVQHLVSNWIMAMAFEDISTLSRTLWSSSECLRCYVCL